MRTATAENRKAARGSAGPDAITLLRSDHAGVRKLFREYRKLCEGNGRTVERSELANRICEELTVHAILEEEIFYPALREALDHQDILNEAEVEHATAKDLISQIEQAEPGDELYDARVIVLGEYIDHHVDEEEGEMFRQARKAGVDLQALGGAMALRRQELIDELGLAEADDDDAAEDEDEDDEEEFEDENALDDEDEDEDEDDDDEEDDEDEATH